ncbi:hypothetical protein ACLB2K_043450 [Fragaria x ananassa]
MLLGRVYLASNEKPYTPSDLSRKLGLLWGDIGSWRIIPMGKGYYTFNFTSEAFRSKVWEKGSIALKPGVLRFMQWTPNFSPASQKNTNAQVWVNLWDLGLEFWEPLTLFEIAHGIGVPVKIDQNTLERKFGLFARVLVDIDLSYDPPRELAVCRNNGEPVIVEVEYERLPDLCSHCGNVGHMVTACKLLRKTGEASVVLEPVRGRSRKPRRRRRKTKQVFVPVDKGKKHLVVVSGNNDSQDGGEGPSFASKSPTPAVDMHHGGHMVDQVVDAIVGQEVVAGEQAALVEQTIIVQPMEQEVVVCDANGARNVVERAVNQHAAPIVHFDMALRINQRGGDEGNVEKQVGDTSEETSDSDSGTRAANSSAPIDTVYARTIVVGRRKLWEDITDVKGRFVNGPWLVFGDFNAVLGMHEKKGGGPVCKRSCEEFQVMSDVCELVHVDTKGAEFTWVRMRGLCGNVELRLDRSLASLEWLDA